MINFILKTVLVFTIIISIFLSIIAFIAAYECWGNFIDIIYFAFFGALYMMAAVLGIKILRFCL